MVVDGNLIVNVKLENDTEKVMGVPESVYKIDESNRFESTYVKTYLEQRYGIKIKEWGNY